MGPIRVFEHEFVAYSREWRGTLFSSFISPLLYLAAMGIGLGSLIEHGAVEGAGDVPYVVWLAPGLLAATAMQAAAFENSWPVVSGFQWHRYFEAAVTTQIRPRDIVVGRILWSTARLSLVLLIFVVVATWLDAIELTRGLLAVPVAVVSGLAMGVVMMAMSSRLERSDQIAAVFRYAVIPMFLFSGTFFPISQLPPLLQPVAWLTPLWHGVELSRRVVLGTATTAPIVVHAAALAAIGIVGFMLSARQFDRRLIA